MTKKKIDPIPTALNAINMNLDTLINILIEKQVFTPNEYSKALTEMTNAYIEKHSKPAA